MVPSTDQIKTRTRLTIEANNDENQNNIVKDN